MKRLQRLIISLLALTVLSLPVAYSATWEEIQRAPALTERIDTEGVDFTTRDGYLYISCSHSVQVKVFTILGQTVVQSTLTPGNYRFRLKAKGIYILKVGSVTRRIVI